ncbi:hypothetical protein [Parasitella parasitica]|uniref:Uncharacterized protein n=1 Tax=Parasitella parasitica TaxID=35722 RepID=A0A0B7N5G0_9FUNG|nr:hypothetical protein [Parasitella parasitica]
MSDHLKFVLHQSLSNNESVKQVLSSIASAFYNRSKISAQEAAYNLLQLRMVESNLSTIFVASSPPETRQRIRKSKLKLEELASDSEDIYQDDSLEQYVIRPADLQHLCLAQFAAHYRYSKTKPRSTALLPAYELREGKGWVRKKQHASILRFSRPHKAADSSLHMYSLMMLYWPWVDEATDLENFDLPSVFEENRALILRNQREFSKLNKDELSMYYIGPFNSLFVDFHAIDNPSYDELQSSSVPFCVSTVNPFTVGGERLTRSSLDEDRDTFLICNTPHDQNMSFSYSFEPTAIVQAAEKATKNL